MARHPEAGGMHTDCAAGQGRRPAKSRGSVHGNGFGSLTAADGGAGCAGNPARFRVSPMSAGTDSATPDGEHRRSGRRAAGGENGPLDGVARCSGPSRCRSAPQPTNPDHRVSRSCFQPLLVCTNTSTACPPGLPSIAPTCGKPAAIAGSPAQAATSCST